MKLIKDKSIKLDILEKGLKKIQDGETLKIGIFHKNFLKTAGHGLLVKKVSSVSYIFFDPNYGEYRGLSFKDLKGHINQPFQEMNGTNMCVAKGEVYLKRLRSKVRTRPIPRWLPL